MCSFLQGESDPKCVSCFFSSLYFFLLHFKLVAYANERQLLQILMATVYVGINSGYMVYEMYCAVVYVWCCIFFLLLSLLLVALSFVLLYKPLLQHATFIERLFLYLTCYIKENTVASFSSFLYWREKMHDVDCCYVF